jgi:tetratricopeptide (TPR) repeat protein
MLCQGNNDPCLCHYYRILALASLSRRRIGETIDYLSFALENAAKSGSYLDIGMAAWYAASIHLLYGNLSRARSLAEKARRHFLEAGSPEWADKARFLMGRLLFEAGLYRQAMDCFEEILKNPDGGSFPEKNNTLEAWAYRARVFFQAPLCPRPQNGVLQSGGPDLELFEIEAAYLSGDYQRTVNLSNMRTALPTALSAALLSTENFYHIERPDWRSGFTQCELLYFSWSELWEKMIKIYHSLALSRISPEGKAEAAKLIQQALRGGQFSEIDPNDVFYHYAWYCVTDHTSGDQIDASTAVSMALKRMQSRAVRIDDMAVRRQYLTQPHWNKALEQAAKDFKLT